MRRLVLIFICCSAFASGCFACKGISFVSTPIVDGKNSIACTDSICLTDGRFTNWSCELSSADSGRFQLSADTLILTYALNISAAARKKVEPTTLKLLIKEERVIPVVTLQNGHMFTGFDGSYYFLNPHRYSAHQIQMQLHRRKKK